MVDFGDESNQDIKINVDIVGAEQSAAKLDAMADALDGVAGATNKQAAELEKIAEKAIRAADSVEKAAEKIQKIKSNATPQETASFDEALERRRLAVSAEREAAAERAAEQEKLAAGQAAKAVAAKLAAAAQITAASSEILRIEKETSAVILERKTALDELARKQAEANTLASKAREEQEAARKRMVELQTTLGLQEATELKPYKGPLISPESIREAEAQIAKIKSDLEKATSGTGVAIAASKTSSYSEKEVRTSPSGGREFLAPTSAWTAEQERARSSFIDAAKELAAQAAAQMPKLTKGQGESVGRIAVKDVAGGKVTDPQEIIAQLSNIVTNSVRAADIADELLRLNKEVDQAKADADAALSALQVLANKGMKASDPMVVDAQEEFQMARARYASAGVDRTRLSVTAQRAPYAEIKPEVARQLAGLISSATPEMRSGRPVAWKGESQIATEASRARETLRSPEVTDLRNKIVALEGEVARATGRTGEYKTPVRSAGQELTSGRPIRDPQGRSNEELRASLALAASQRDEAARRSSSAASSAAEVEKLAAAARSAYIAAETDAKRKISEAVSGVIGEVDMEGLVSDVVRDIADQMVKEFISSGAKTEKEIADFRENILATGTPINSGAKPSATASGNQRKGASVTSLREGDVAEIPVTGAAQIAAREVASEILKQSPAIRAISSMQGREEIDAQIQADTARRRSSGVSGGSEIPSDLTRIGSIEIQRGVSKQHVDTLEKELTLLQAIEDKDDDVIARTKEISDELNQIRKGDGVATAQDSGVIGQILKALNVSRDTAIGGESSRMGSFPSPFPLATVGSLFTSRGRKQAVDEADPEGLGNPIERALTVRREKTGARGREAVIAQAGAADLGEFAEMVDGTVTGIQGIFARISRNFSKGDKVDPETISALKEQIIGLMAIMKTVQELQIDKSIPKGEQAGLQKLKEAVGVLGSGGGGVSAALTALTRGSLTNASTESIIGKSPEERQAVNADLAKHVLVDLIPNLDRLNDVVRAMLDITPQKTPGSGQALIPGMPMGEFGAAANRSTVASIADTVASGSPDQITAVIAEALARNILDEDALRSLVPGEPGPGGKAATKDFQQFDSGDGKFDLGTAEQRVRFAEVIQKFPSVMEVLASFPALSQLIGYDPALLEKLATEEEVARADIAALKERLEGFKRAVPKMAEGAAQIKSYSFGGSSDSGAEVPTELFKPVTSTAGMSPQQIRSITPQMIPADQIREWRGPGAGEGGDVRDRKNFTTSEAEAVAESVIAFLMRKGYSISSIDKDQNPQKAELTRRMKLSTEIPPKTTITVVHKTENLKDDPAAMSAVGELLKLLQTIPTANRGLTVSTTSSTAETPNNVPGFSMITRGFQSPVQGAPYETYGSIQVAEREKSGIPMPGFSTIASHEAGHMAVIGGSRGSVGMEQQIEPVHSAIGAMIDAFASALEDTSQKLDPEVARKMSEIVNDFFGNMGRSTGNVTEDLNREVAEYIANVLAQMSGHTQGGGRSIAPRTGTYTRSSEELMQAMFSTGQQPGITSSTGSMPMSMEKLYSDFSSSPGLTRRLRLGDEGKVQITDEEPSDGYTVGGAQLENPKSGLLNFKASDIASSGDFRAALDIMLRENESEIRKKILDGVDVWIGMYGLSLTDKSGLGDKNAPSVPGTAFDITSLVPTGEKDRAIEMGKARGQDSIGGYQGGSWADDMFVQLREEGDRQAVTMNRGRDGSFSRVPGTSSIDMPGNRTYGFGDGRQNKDDNIDDLDFNDFLEPAEADKASAGPSKEEYDAQVAEANAARKERLAAMRKAREAAKKAAKAAEAEAAALELAAAESERVANIETEAVQQSQEVQQEAPVQAATPAGPPAPPARPPAPPTPPAGPPPPPAGPPSGGANDIDILVNQAIAKLGLGTSLPTLNEAILKLSAIVEQAVNARYEAGTAGGVSMDKGALQDEIVNSNIGGIGDLAKFLDGLLSISETIRSQGGLPAVDIGGKTTQVASASAAIAGATYVPDGMKKQELLKIAQELNDLGNEVVLLIQMARQGKLKIEQEVQSASASANKEMDGLTARRVTVEERRNSAQQGSSPDDWRDTRAQVPQVSDISRGIEDLAKLQGRYSQLGPVVLHARSAQDQFGKSLEDSVGKADRASDALRRLTDTNVGILKTVRTQVGRAATFLVLQQMGREIGGIIQHLQSGVFHFNQVLENTQVGFNTLFANTLQARASVGGELIPKLNEAGQMIGFMREQAVDFKNALDFTAGAAAGMVAEIRNIANVTPFRFQPLVEASLKMKAFGFEATEIPGMINAISNAVAALGGEDEKIDRIAYALGQMNSAGRVYQNDMMQLANAGIAGYRMLSEKLMMDLTAMKKRSLGLMKDLPEETVKEFDRLQNMLNSASFKKSFGNIDAMIQTLQDPKRAEGLIRNLAKRGFLIGSTAARAITEGMDKQYQGSADRLSRTMTGALSTIADLSQNFMATAFQPLFNSVRDTIVELGQFMLKSSEITKTVDSVRKNMQSFIASLASFGPALETAGKIFIDVFVSGLGSALEKGTAFGNVMTSVVSNVGPGLKMIGDVLQNDVGKGLVVATLAFTVFSRAITANPMIASVTLLVAAISGIATAIEKNSAATAFVGSFIKTFIPAVEQLFKVIGDAVTTVVTGITEGGLAGFIVGLSVAIDILMPLLTMFLTVMAVIAKVLAPIATPLGFIVGLFLALKTAMMAFDLAGTIIGKAMGSIGGAWNSVNASIDNQISKVKETARAYEELRNSKIAADDYQKNAQGEYLDSTGAVVSDKSRAALRWGSGEKVNSYGMTELKGQISTGLLGGATSMESGKQAAVDYLQNSRGIRPDFGGGFSLTHEDRQLGHTVPIITNKSIEQTYGNIGNADRELQSFTSGRNLGALSPADADRYEELKKAAELKRQASAAGLFRFAGMDGGAADVGGNNRNAGAYSMDNMQNAILVQKETSWILNRTFTQLEEAGKQIVAMQEQISKIKAQMLSGEIGEDEGLDRISGIKGQIDTITSGQSKNMKIVGGLAEAGIPGLKGQLEVEDFGKRAIQIPPELAAGIKEMPADVQNIIMSEIVSRFAQGEVFTTKQEQEQFAKGVLGDARGKEFMKASTVGLLSAVGAKLGAGLRRLVGGLPSQMTTYNRGGGSSGMREMDSRGGQHYYVDQQTGMLSNEMVPADELARRKTLKGGGLFNRMTSKLSGAIGVGSAIAGLTVGASRLAGQIAPIMAAPIIGPLMSMLPSEFTNVFRQKAGPFQAMAAGIGTTAGSILGQALIPIPGVGAALGGMIGGALGELVGNAVDKAVEGTEAAMKYKKAAMEEAEFLGFTKEQSVKMAEELNKLYGRDATGGLIVQDPGEGIGLATNDARFNPLSTEEYEKRKAAIEEKYSETSPFTDPMAMAQAKRSELADLEREKNERNLAFTLLATRDAFNALAPSIDLARAMYGEDVVGAKARHLEFQTQHRDEMALINGRIAQGEKLTSVEKELIEEMNKLAAAAALDPFGLQGTFMDVAAMGGAGQIQALDYSLKRGGTYTQADADAKVTNAKGEVVTAGEAKTTTSLVQLMAANELENLAIQAGWGNRVADALIALGLDMSKIAADTPDKEVYAMMVEALNKGVEMAKRAQELTPKVDMRMTRLQMMEEFGNEAGYKLFDDYAGQRDQYQQARKEYKAMGGDARLGVLESYESAKLQGGVRSVAITPQVPRDQIGGQDAGQKKTINEYVELNLLTTKQKAELEELRKKEKEVGETRNQILELTVKHRKVFSDSAVVRAEGIAKEKEYAQFQITNQEKLAAAVAAGSNATKEQIDLLSKELKLQQGVYTIGKQKLDIGAALQAAEAQGLVITNKDLTQNAALRDLLVQKAALIKAAGTATEARVNGLVAEAQAEANISKIVALRAKMTEAQARADVAAAKYKAKVAAMGPLEPEQRARLPEYKAMQAAAAEVGRYSLEANNLVKLTASILDAAEAANPFKWLKEDIEKIRKMIAKDPGSILGGDGGKKDSQAIEKNISLLTKMGNVAQQAYDRMRKAQKRTHDEYIEQLDEQEKRINDRYKDRSDQQTEENLQAQLQIAGLQMRSSSADPLEAAKSFYDAKQALEEFYIGQQRDAELKVVADEKERYEKQYADTESAAQEIYDAAMKRLNSRFEFADMILTSGSTTEAQLNNALRMTMFGVTGQDDSYIPGATGLAGSGDDTVPDDGVDPGQPEPTAAEKNLKSSKEYFANWGPTTPGGIAYTKAMAVAAAKRTAKQKKTISDRDLALAKMIAEQNYNKAREQNPSLPEAPEQAVLEQYQPEDIRKERKEFQEYKDFVLTDGNFKGKTREARYEILLAKKKKTAHELDLVARYKKEKSEADAELASVTAAKELGREQTAPVTVADAAVDAATPAAEYVDMANPLDTLNLFLQEYGDEVLAANAAGTEATAEQEEMMMRLMEMRADATAFERDEFTRALGQIQRGVAYNSDQTYQSRGAVSGLKIGDRAMTAAEMKVFRGTTEESGLTATFMNEELMSKLSYKDDEGKTYKGSGILEYLTTIVDKLGSPAKLNEEQSKLFEYIRTLASTKNTFSGAQKVAILAQRTLEQGLSEFEGTTGVDINLANLAEADVTDKQFTDYFAALGTTFENNAERDRAIERMRNALRDTYGQALLSIDVREYSKFADSNDPRIGQFSNAIDSLKDVISQVKGVMGTDAANLTTLDKLLFGLNYDPTAPISGLDFGKEQINAVKTAMESTRGAFESSMTSIKAYAQELGGPIGSFHQQTVEGASSVASAMSSTSAAFSTAASQAVVYANALAMVSEIANNLTVPTPSSVVASAPATGDGRMYAGGTPYFDESTGLYTDGRAQPEYKAGDGRMYAGGTPYFDESTGLYTDGREQPVEGQGKVIDTILASIAMQLGVSLKAGIPGTEINPLFASAVQQPFDGSGDQYGTVENVFNITVNNASGMDARQLAGELARLIAQQAGSTVN